jgi:hypothetical protein
MLIRWYLCVCERERRRRRFVKEMDAVMEEWRWEMNGYECMIGVFWYLTLG